MKKLAGILIATTLAGALVGCGGDDDADVDSAATTTAQSITKAEFLAQANAICAAGNAEIDAALAGVTETTTEEELTTIINEQVVGSVRTQIADIRALGFPDGDAELLDAIFTDSEAALDQVAADPIGTFVDTTEDPFADLNARLADYGLTACAE